MKKVIVISDIHLHPWTAFAQGAGWSNSRLQQTLKVVRNSLEAAREQNALWICPGDFVHTHGYAQNIVLSNLVKLCTDFSYDVEMFGVWGNHDARGSGSKIRLEETAAYVLSEAGLRILDSELYQTKDKIKIYGAGYQPKNEFIELTFKADIGVFHQTVIGTKNAHGFEFKEGILASELSDKYRTVLVGHVHQPEYYADPETGHVLIVPGSPEQQNFGEMGDHGWWELDLEKNAEAGGWYCKDAKLVKSDSPVFVTVSDLKQVKKGDGNYYRITGGVKNPDKLPDNVIAVGVTPENTGRAALGGSTDPQAILQQWMEKNPPPPVDREMLLATGLDLLSSREMTVLRDFTLKQVLIDNFMPFEMATFDVRPGVHLVTGNAKDFQSNGAGKTTLWEALYWCLTGDTTKGLGSDDVIRRGSKQSKVTLDFENLEGRSVQATRSRSKSLSTLQVTVDGVPYEEGSVTDRTRFLQKVLGVSPQIFKILAYFSQEELLLFSRATDSTRKDIIKDLTGTELYQEAMTAAKENGRLKNEEVSRVTGRLEVLQTQHLEDTATLQTRRESLAAWELARTERVADAQAALTQNQQKVEALQQDLATRWGKTKERLVALSERAVWFWENKIEGRAQEIVVDLTDRYATRTGELSFKLAEIEQQIITEFGSVEGAKALCLREDVVQFSMRASKDKLRGLEKTQTETFEKGSDARLALQTADTAAAELQGKLANAKTDSEKLLLSVSEKKCYACGQELSQEEAISHMQVEMKDKVLLVSQYTQDLIAAQNAQTAAEQDVGMWMERTADIAREIKEENEKQDKLKLAWDRLQECKALVIAYTTQKDLITLALSNIEDFSVQAKESATTEMRLRRDARTKALAVRGLQYSQHMEKLSKAAADQLQTFASELPRVLAEVNPHDAIVSDLYLKVTNATATISKTIAEQQKLADERSIYGYWANAFSRTGIQSLLIDEIVELFNAHRSTIFPLLTHGVFDAQFSTTSQTAAGELREKTEFQIREHGLPVPYEGLSGGQRRRIDLGVMLTLALAVSQQHNVPGVLGIMVLDEVFAFLDDDGAEGLFDALREVQKTIPALYCVTHDAHLQSMFPSVVHIEQDANGVSRIVEAA